MNIIIGLSEIIVGILLIILTWTCDFSKRYFNIGSRQADFFYTHVRRKKNPRKRDMETEASHDVLKRNPWILNTLWSIAAFACICLGVAALCNSRKSMMIEIIIPISLLLTIMLFLIFGIDRQDSKIAD